MSQTMPLDLVEYARALFAPDDSEIEALTAAAAAAGMPAGWEITPDVGRLFQLLCQSVRARRVLEFGTLAGHSALWFARALPPGGTVVSVEIDPRFAAAARRALNIIGVGERVDIRIGNARDLLPELERETAGADGTPFDVIFLDADKAHYPEFLDWSVGVLRPGGLLLADNVLRSGSWNGQTLLDPASDDPRILAIREFNRRLAAHPDFTSLIVPMRSGVAIALFKPRNTGPDIQHL